MKKAIAVMLFAVNVAWAEQLPFYVFKDKPSRENHYIPSGWMGATTELKLSENAKPKEGTSSEQFTWTPKDDSLGWVGVYYQYPANNWGKQKSPFNLNGAKKLTFWARGEKGGEVISEFKMGGISGDYMDSDSSGIGPITLTKDWKQYEIDLTNKELSMIIGGFCWAVNRDGNPNGLSFYIDEIRYE